MSSRRIIQRKNYLVRRDLSAGVSWPQNIDIEFHVHEMIVKSVLYIQDALQQNTDYLTSNLVNYDPMSFISDSVVQHNPNTVFKLDRQVRGPFQFEVRKEDNAPSDGTGSLLVILEFLQYSD